MSQLPIFELIGTLRKFHTNHRVYIALPKKYTDDFVLEWAFGKEGAAERKRNILVGAYTPGKDSPEELVYEFVFGGFHFLFIDISKYSGDPADYSFWPRQVDEYPPPRPLKWIKYNKDDFKYDDNMLKCGSLVKTDDGEVHLIGDANIILGVCDDCTLKGVEYYCTDFVEQINAIKEQAKL